MRKIVLAVFVPVTVALYFPCIHPGFFVWDDAAVALAPVIRNASFHGLWQTFSQFHVGLYHPITTISFMIDYRIGNGSAIPFHVTNLLLHICNTLLIYFLTKKLVSGYLIPFLVALLFAIFPGHVESVAWITSRKDLLYTLFYLASMFVYIRYVDDKKVKWLILSCFLFLFSLFSKVQAVTLPIVLFGIDYLRGRKMSGSLILEKIPFLLLAIVIGFLNIQAQKAYGYISYGQDFNWFEQGFLLIYSMSQYLIKTLLPFQWSVFYPYPFQAGQPIPFSAILSAAIPLLGISIVAFWKKAGNRIVVFGLLFFLLNLLVVFSASRHRDSIIAERYLYLGSAGMFLIMSYYLVTLYQRFRKIRILMGILFIGYLSAFGWSCYARNVIWRSPEAVFTHSVARFPDSEILLNTLGSIKVKNQALPEAIRLLNRAIELDPFYVDAWYNRGLAFKGSGQYERSIQDFSTSLNINPNYTPAYFARGNVYQHTHQFDQALQDYSAVLAIDREHTGALYNRAIVKGYLQDFKGSIADLNQAILLEPGNASCYYLRGIAFFEIGMNGCADLWQAKQLGYQNAEKAIAHYCSPSPIQ